MTNSDFRTRHIGTSHADQRIMAERIGVADAADLLDKALPASVRGPIGEPWRPRSEREVLDDLSEMASGNRRLASMIGLGFYDTFTPPVLSQALLHNPAWYTAYTPYQPEISQGRLEALLTFQTMVADLTALPYANASLLDEASAAAEAMLLAKRVDRLGRHRFAIDADLFEHTRAVVANRAEPLGIELVEFCGDDPLPADVFGALIQFPGASGAIPNPAEHIRQAHDAGALVAISADLLSLTLLRPPGELQADIATGSTQRFGVPMGFGGPNAGYMAVRDGLQRQLPGRLVGVSIDSGGEVAYRLALQTREQHIRRQKATSNICTAQVLLAVMAGMFAVWHGPDGLRDIAGAVHDKAARLAAMLAERGFTPEHRQFFDTVGYRVPGRAEQVVAAARDLGVNLAGIDGDLVQISCDEVTTEDNLAAVVEAFERAGRTAPGPKSAAADGLGDLPAALQRTSQFLTHPVFGSYRSETAMMRYLRRLAGKDYALDRGMIPLGSCTMKLNSAVEMAAITWPEFAGLHPYAPAEDCTGYRRLIDSLGQRLLTLTGYEAISMQPNAGSQGELAGLLAIRRYHRDRGEDRTICLVPASAHGTNAASAALAGLAVEVVATDSAGNIDLADLQAKLAEHGQDVAAIMITYPSTHGVYETEIATMCELVHRAGGQVYIDGANLNALVGWSRPGDFGGDVSHLNLHKTFAIPHGGGGPGVGPLAAKAHLAPYLPGHPASPWPGCAGQPVAAAPFGSASVLPISWAYLELMGSEGLRSATEAAVLAANYIACRLGETFPILYRGNGGLLAHECLLDLRPLLSQTGIGAEDVAKRLIDYGFHAPTMSFPVAGTLMVEPTESEDLAELDRFCDAMVSIYQEAQAVAAGTWPADDNPLRNAPHTAASLVGPWDHPYDRATAVFPDPSTAGDKYWPPVGRIDGAYGDRHLVCTWPAAPTGGHSDDNSVE